MRQVFARGEPGRNPVAGKLVVAGSRVFSSGLAMSAGDGLETDARTGLERAIALLREAGLAHADVVRTRVFYIDPDAEPVLRAVHGAAFGRAAPAFSAIRVSCLPGDARVAIELEGVRGGGSGIQRHRVDLRSGTSVGVELDGEVWLSGMTASSEGALSLATGEPADQIRLAINRTESALEELGLSVADVVATRHFLRPELQGRPRVAEWVDFMRRATPTSAGIAVEGVSSAGAGFMFEADAVRGASRDRHNLRTGRTYEVEHHYCRAVRVGQRDVVYVAGTTSIIPGEIVQHPGEVGPQVHDTLAIIRWAIEQQGLAWTDLARTRTYVVGGPEGLQEAIDALRVGLEGVTASTTLVGVPVLGRPTVVVEIEATAVQG